MVDPSEHEIAAIIETSQPAGEYIESVGRSDMATWSNDQWLGFIECVVTNYTTALRRLADNEVPF